MFSLSAFYLCNSRLARARRPREDRDRGRPAWRIGRRRLEEPRQPAGRNRPAREGPLKRGRSRPEPPAPREHAKARKSPAPCAPRRRGQYRATPGTAEAADGRGRPPGARKAHPGAREVSPSAGGGASRRGGGDQTSPRSPDSAPLTPPPDKHRPPSRREVGGNALQRRPGRHRAAKAAGTRRCVAPTTEAPREQGRRVVTPARPPATRPPDGPWSPSRQPPWGLLPLEVTGRQAAVSARIIE